MAHLELPAVVGCGRGSAARLLHIVGGALPLPAADDPLPPEPGTRPGDHGPVLPSPVLVAVDHHPPARRPSSAVASSSSRVLMWTSGSSSTSGSAGRPRQDDAEPVIPG